MGPSRAPGEAVRPCGALEFSPNRSPNAPSRWPAPPFHPFWITPAPVLRPEDEPPRRQHRRANPFAEGIVYPCGIVPWPDGSWLVSYGVNDEHCRLRWVTLAHNGGLCAPLRLQIGDNRQPML